MDTLVSPMLGGLKQWLFPNTSSTPTGIVGRVMPRSEDEDLYLSHFLNKYHNKRDGSDRNTCSLTHAEHRMVLTTLLRSGSVHENLETPELNATIKVLKREVEADEGLAGFAPRISNGVGDVSQRLLLLSILENKSGGWPDDTWEQMAAALHEAEHTWTTTASVWDTNFSAGCLVLLLLIRRVGTGASQYLPLITRVTEFLCSTWWATDGSINDETSICHIYSYLLLVKAFTDLLSWVSENRVPTTLDNNLILRVRITLFQACLRTMLEQGKDRSWDTAVEETAYGALILSEARRLDFMEDLKDHIDYSIEQGARFLKTASDTESSRREQPRHRCPILTQAYKLVAIRKSAQQSSTAQVDTQYQSIKGSEKAAMAQLKLFSKTPLFSEVPQWQIRASLIEAKLFLPLLRPLRLKTFPREDMEADKYFEIIPFTWTACNNRRQTFASTSLLFEMMVISFLNYQADEFMEAVAGPAFEGDLDSLRELIRGLFIDEEEDERQKELIYATAAKRHEQQEQEQEHEHEHEQEHKVRDPLSKFVAHVLQHPAVRNASPWDREHVKRNLRTFLLAHVTQTEDNCRFAASQDQGSLTFTGAGDSFYHWVHTTSADHTSCPYAFAFISCLIASSLAGGEGEGEGESEDCFPTATQKYLAEAMCRCLATMCRMYNDYGSVSRDRLEGNLNSVNFPEFLTESPASIPSGSHDEEDEITARKETLLALAGYEREDLNEIFSRLDAAIESASEEKTSTSEFRSREKRKMAIVGMFIDVTDLYGQIYVIRDIASRMTRNVGSAGK